MGNCMTKKGSKPPITLAILGLDNAGKTVTTKGLQGETLDAVAPTIGFSSVDFVFDKHDVTMFDLGGGKKIRNIWKNYFAEIYGLVYVVDSSATSRIEECQSVLHNLLQHPQIHGKPLLLLANKQDISGALDEMDICEYLGLEEMVNKYKTPCRVEPCSAIIGQGKKLDKSISNGMAWLVAMIMKDMETLKLRVEEDIAELREKESKEKKERAERVRKIREERERQEKAERLARGEAEPESEDEGISEGGPFKRLNKTELEIKDKQLKEAKRQQKLSKEQENDLLRKSKSENVHSSIATRNSFETNDRLRGNYNQNKTEYSDEEGYNSDSLHGLPQKSVHSSLPPLRGGSDVYSSPTRSGSLGTGARLGQYDSPRPNRRLIKSSAGGSDSEGENYDKRTSSSLDSRSPWMKKSMGSEDFSPSQFRSGLAPIGRNNEDMEIQQTRKSMLSPIGPLQPLEDLDKKKKKKKKARKNQTAPDISGGEEDGLEPHNWSVPPAPRASRSPRLDTVEEPDNESDNAMSGFAHKFNLIDELPEMTSTRSHHSTSRRGPNTDYDDDLMT